MLLTTWPWNHDKIKSYKTSFDAVWANKVISVAVNTCMKINSYTWSNQKSAKTDRNKGKAEFSIFNG